MNVKQCRQCGEIKPLERYRKYYGNRKGHYTICHECEKINARYKYLLSKGDARTEEETTELEQIKTLYDLQRKAGLQPPREDGGRKAPVKVNLAAMIENYQQSAIAQEGFVRPTTPAELAHWLTVELDEDPEYYLDEVYEDLKHKFRPVQHIDKSTLLPVYDEAFKEELDKVLERFNAYEDAYYNKD